MNVAGDNDEVDDVVEDELEDEYAADFMVLLDGTRQLSVSWETNLHTTPPWGAS